MDAVGDHRQVVVGRDAGREHRELVPAQPRHRVSGADRRFQPARDLHEDGVTGGVPKPVVDRFEPVEVQVQQAHAAAVPAAAAQQVLEPREQHRPVGQPGQRVVQRHRLEHLLVLFAAGEVVHVDQGERGRRRRVEAGRGEFDPELVARSHGEAGFPLEGVDGADRELLHPRVQHDRLARVVRHPEHGVLTADQLLGFVAEHLRQCGVHVQDFAHVPLVEPHRVDADQRFPDGDTQGLLAVAGLRREPRPVPGDEHQRQRHDRDGRDEQLRHQLTPTDIGDGRERAQAVRRAVRGDGAGKQRDGCGSDRIEPDRRPDDGQQHRERSGFVERLQEHPPVEQHGGHEYQREFGMAGQGGAPPRMAGQ